MKIKKQPRLIATLVLKNLGKTPAINCISDRNYALVSVDEKIPKSFYHLETNNSQTAIFTAPDKRILLGVILPEKEALELQRGEKALMFHAYCEYNTTSDSKKRITSFFGQVWFNGDKPVEGKSELLDFRYEIAPHGKNNINT